MFIPLTFLSTSSVLASYCVYLPSYCVQYILAVSQTAQDTVEEVALLLQSKDGEGLPEPAPSHSSQQDMKAVTEYLLSVARLS